MDVYYIRNMYSKKCNKKLALNNLHQAGPSKPILSSIACNTDVTFLTQLATKRPTFVPILPYSQLSNGRQGQRPVVMYQAGKTIQLMGCDASGDK